MAIKRSVDELLHRIRVKLYPNYLPKAEGKYISRTNNEAFLSIEQVCAALKVKGGFSSNIDEITKHVRLFLDEAVYQLCDGFGINMDYFSIYPNIGGTYNSVNETFDHEKNPISFRFRTLAALRRMIKFITVEIDGVAATGGYIDEFFDGSSQSVNEILTASEQFSVSGYKIKVSGDNPECGVYFEPLEDKGQRIKVKSTLMENSPSKIIGMVPELVTPRTYRVVIVTQYTRGKGLLKEPRTITSDFALTAA
jgi:hypothetical protein